MPDRAKYFGQKTEDGFPLPQETYEYESGVVYRYKNSFVAYCEECDWYRSRPTLRSAIATINEHYRWKHEGSIPDWAQNL